MFLVKESVFSLKDFWCMITRVQDQVQLSIYSTRALFHKYLVAMKYR